MNIMWKPVSEYENLYEVSNTGEVRSLIRGKIMKPSDNGKGYLQVSLTKNKQSKRLYVHRLVANEFLDKGSCCEEVNHIDGKKYNNSVSNLEWCDDDKNREHAYLNGLRKMKPIVGVEVYSLQDEPICEFVSISEASRKMKIPVGNIAKCCNGRSKSAGGYIFKKAKAGEQE